MVNAPLGLAYNKKYEDELNFYEVFRMFRYLKFQNNLPSLAIINNFKIKKDKEVEFFNYAWEFDLLEIIYTNNTRPFNNEELCKHSLKLKRASKDIKDYLRTSKEVDNFYNNTVPKRSIGDLLFYSIKEKRAFLSEASTMLSYLAEISENDIKLKKKNRPREVLSLIYPIKILTKIYNCIDWKLISLKHYNSFIHDQLITLPPLKDLNLITITNAIKKSKDYSFMDLYLRSVNNKEELEKIKISILS